jgi:hypothetical protein
MSWLDCYAQKRQIEPLVPKQFRWSNLLNRLARFCVLQHGFRGCSAPGYKSYAEPLWREVRKAAPTSGGLVFFAILNP